jgi:WD40 repeat protein
MTLPPTPRPPHPYARRHLAAHAAAGGKLDDVLNLETLPYLDEARLSTLLRLTEPAPLSRQWLLLSAWRSIRHRWSWDDPDANAAALDVAQLAVDPMAPLPDRWTASGLGWKPRLVEWQSGGTIVAGDERGGLPLSMGAVQGVPILLTGDPWWVRLWDPATGQPIGEPLHAPHLILALAVAEGPGLVVAACEGGHVIAWDAVTHVPSATVEISEPIPAALAVGEIEDRWVVAAGGASGVVQVRWIDSGELVHEFRDNKQVRAVALAKSRSGRLHLAIGYGDGEDGWIAVHDAASGESRNPGIAVRGKVNDAALALVEGELVVAAGTTMGIAGVWNALSGAPASSPVSHDGEVSSVALATIGGSHLLATGSRDRTARLSYVPAGGSAGPPLPHPAPVESLAFGEVDGRTMLATGCLDGNTRLWDPLRASAARVAVEGWFPSVAMDTDLVVAESDDGHVRLWNIASGYSYPPLPVEPGYEPSSEPVDLPDVKVRLGGMHPRILLAQHGGRVGIWDMSDSSEPAFRGQTEIGNMTDFDLHAGRGLPLLATLDNAGEVMVVDLPTGTRLFQIRIGGADSVSFIETPEHLLLGVGVRRQMHLLDV